MMRTAISEEDLRPTAEQEPDPATVEHWTDDEGRTAEIVRYKKRKINSLRLWEWSDLDGAERMTCSVTVEIDSEGILADDIVAEWRAWLRDAKRIDDDVIERAVLVTMATCIQYEITIKRW